MSNYSLNAVVYDQKTTRLFANIQRNMRESAINKGEGEAAVND